MKTYAVDIDGTLCIEQEEYWKYADAMPVPINIRKINELYDKGHIIVIHTSRFKEDVEVTRTWLKRHGVKYHRIITEKFRADFYVDSNAVTPEAL
jgi:uncharacterized HAD superfamily protein